MVRMATHRLSVKERHRFRVRRRAQAARRPNEAAQARLERGYKLYAQEIRAPTTAAISLSCGRSAAGVIGMRRPQRMRECWRLPQWPR
jgi:hypothetical protein